MINWKIEPNGDIQVLNGSLERVTGDDAIIQNLRATLYHSIQEWFLDMGFGIDYKNQVLTKVFDPVKASRAIKRAIKNAEGIQGVNSFEMTKDGHTVSVSFEARTINTTIIRLDEDLQI